MLLIIFLSERERERERESGGERQRSSNDHSIDVHVYQAVIESVLFLGQTGTRQIKTRFSHRLSSTDSYYYTLLIDSYQRLK